MSNVSDEATQEVKKKVGRGADRLRPSPWVDRAAAPAPSQQNAYPTIPAPEVKPRATAAMTNEQVCVCDEGALHTQLTHHTIEKRYEEDKTRCD